MSATYSFGTFVSLEAYFTEDRSTVEVAEVAAADLEAARKSAQDEVEDALGEAASQLAIKSIDFVELDGSIKPHHNAAFLVGVEGPRHLINALRRAIEEE